MDKLPSELIVLIYSYLINNIDSCRNLSLCSKKLFWILKNFVKIKKLNLLNLNFELIKPNFIIIPASQILPPLIHTDVLIHKFLNIKDIKSLNINQNETYPNFSLMKFWNKYRRDFISLEEISINGINDLINLSIFDSITKLIFIPSCEFTGLEELGKLKVIDIDYCSYRQTSWHENLIIVSNSYVEEVIYNHPRHLKEIPWIFDNMKKLTISGYFENFIYQLVAQSKLESLVIIINSELSTNINNSFWISFNIFSETLLELIIIDKTPKGIKWDDIQINISNLKSLNIQSKTHHLIPFQNFKLPLNIKFVTLE